MFFASKLCGTEIFSAAFQSLPIDSATKNRTVSRYLNITEATLKRWLSGASAPPRAAVAAIWLESPEGRAAVSGHTVEETLILRRLANAQQGQIDALRKAMDEMRAELDAAKRGSNEPVPANEPYWVPGLEVPRYMRLPASVP